MDQPVHSHVALSESYAVSRISGALLEVLRRRVVARVDRRGQERRRVVLPELAHLAIRVDHHVHEPAVTALDTADVDVDDRGAVGGEVDRALLRVGWDAGSERLAGS